MSPISVRPRRVAIAELVVLAVAIVGFVAVTAAQGASTINIALPPIEKWIYGAIVAAIGEMGRRTLKKLDKIGLKCDRTHERLEKVDTALRGYDGNGGALEDIRLLQRDVSELQRAPRGPMPPAGFNISPPAQARAVNAEKP